MIDLTNTSRYYQASDWKKEGIKHVKVGVEFWWFNPFVTWQLNFFWPLLIFFVCIKIQCRGRDSVPENEAVNCFVYEVSFLLDVSLICTWFVHCFYCISVEVCLL